MNFKYELDSVPPIGELLLFGLQWLVVTIPSVVIIGKVVAGLHYSDFNDQIIYIQKIFFITALTLLVQLVWGHRLPLILGPATVLLVGVVASQGSSMEAVYTSIMIGGGILSLAAVAGLFGQLKKLFTPRVVAAILILIAFTITPTIISLILPPGSPALFNLCFTLVLVVLTFFANSKLTGIWKSTLIIWAIIAGTLAYLLGLPGQIRSIDYGFSVLRIEWMHGCS